MGRKKRALAPTEPTLISAQCDCTTSVEVMQELKDKSKDLDMEDQKKIATKDKKIGKSREWTCLVYPDSAAKNWKQIAQQTYLEVYISPLHDKDENPDGTQKKPHYHVVLVWAGPTTYSHACEIASQFGGIVEPRVVGSLRGICRYLCHLDNPEKAPYNPEDVICYNGADWDLVINLKSDRYRSLEEMMEFCNKYKITSFLTLNTYAMKKRKSDWFRTLCDSGAYIMREYCKSLEWQIEHMGHVLSIDEIEQLIEDIEKQEDNHNESNN